MAPDTDHSQRFFHAQPLSPCQHTPAGSCSPAAPSAHHGQLRSARHLRAHMATSQQRQLEIMWGDSSVLGHTHCQLLSMLVHLRHQLSSTCCEQTTSARRHRTATDVPTVKQFQIVSSGERLPPRTSRKLKRYQAKRQARAIQDHHVPRIRGSSMRDVESRGSTAG
jgi:hypothetical protein